MCEKERLERTKNVSDSVFHPGTASTSTSTMKHWSASQLLAFFVFAARQISKPTKKRRRKTGGAATAHPSLKVIHFFCPTFENCVVYNFEYILYTIGRVRAPFLNWLRCMSSFHHMLFLLVLLARLFYCLLLHFSVCMLHTRTHIWVQFGSWLK